MVFVPRLHDDASRCAKRGTQQQKQCNQSAHGGRPFNRRSLSDADAYAGPESKLWPWDFADGRIRAFSRECVDAMPVSPRRTDRAAVRHPQRAAQPEADLEHGTDHGCAGGAPPSPDPGSVTLTR